MCRQARGAFGDKAFADESAPENQPRDRAFHVKHIRLEVAPDLAAKAVAGTSTLTLTPINDGLRKRQFRTNGIPSIGGFLNSVPGSLEASTSSFGRPPKTY